MGNIYKSSLLVGFLCLVTMQAATAEMSVQELQKKGYALEQKAENTLLGYGGETRSLTLTLINAHGQESVRKLEYEAMEGDDGNDKTLLRFLYPSDTKGTTLLTHEKKDADDDQWLYLPALRRVKRIATSNQSGSFMGSEFAYEDIVVRQLDRFTYKYLGEEEIEGTPLYVVEGVPKSEDSGYSKIIRWRYKDNLQEYKTEFYDKKGQLYKKRVMSNYKKVDGFWRAEKITVTNVQTNKASVIEYRDNKVRLSLPEKNFRVNALARLN